jgi:PAS domain S-box-containing protein/putative nucleotidyltransferase with HDIG domain
VDNYQKQEVLDMTRLSIADGDRSKLYELLWQHEADAVFVADAQTGYIIDLNPAACALLGKDRNSALAMHQSELHPAHERLAVREAFVSAADQPLVITGFHLLTIDGQEIPVEISSSQRLPVSDGEIIIGIFRDTREQEANRALLQSQNWALNAYSSALSGLSKSKSVESAFAATCDAIITTDNYLLSWIGIAQNDLEKTVKVAAAAGPAQDYLSGIQISWDEQSPHGTGPTGQAIRSGKIRLMRNSDTSNSFSPWRERAAKFGIHSSISIPFSIEDEKAALVVYSSRPDAFTPVAIQVFERLAEHLSFTLRSLRISSRLAEEQVEREAAQSRFLNALESAIGAIAATMERRDPYTAGHEERVANIACGIAEKLNLPPDQIHAVRLSALVHDIGKISVPAEILTKPGRLSPVEFLLVKEHPETGYRILKEIPFPWPLADIVRQHHEKIDGSGYPLGLSGDQILLEAKILAVADIVESISSFRPYRPAMGIEAAIKIIVEEAGKTLDAQVVHACIDLFQSELVSKDFIPAPKIGGSNSASISKM